MSLHLHLLLRKPKPFCYLLFLFFQISFFSARAGGEVIQALTSGGPVSSITVNPCDGVGLGFTPDITLGGITKVDWLVNNVLAKTVTDGSPNVLLSVNAYPFSVSCRITYQGSNTVVNVAAFNGVNIQSIDMDISGPTTVNRGCLSPINYSTTIDNLSPFKPAPALIASYNWSLPPNWTISGASNSTPAVVPDATSAGNLTVELVLTCGFHKTFAPVVAISRGAFPPTFSSGTPITLCDNTTTPISIDAPCGPANYTYTITGNGIAKFQANNAQTLTTTSASVNISTGALAGVGTNLSVVANYPGGTSSTPINTSFTSGAPVTSALSIVSQGPTFCPNVPIGFGARYNGNCSNLGSAGITNITWSVAPAPAQITYNAGMARCGATENNSGVQIKFNSSPTMYHVWITATNSCGTSGLSNPITVTLAGPGSCPPGPMSATNTADPASSALSDFDPAFASAGATLSPNPSTGRVAVTLTSGALSAGKSNPGLIRQIDVYNTQGVHLSSLIYGHGINGSSTIDLGNMPNGIYILVITAEKGKFNKKVAIVR